jgi:outer membrane protein assembly factor BamB
MRYATIAIVWTILATLASADNWPEWRGPSGNGVAPEGDYPTEWSATKNIRWRFELPGPGASTPIVWEDRIYLTCAVDGENAVLCLDREGKPHWQTLVGKERAGKNKKATGSNPSIATDGQRLYAYFKSGDLACLDPDGKIVWRHNLQDDYGEDTLWWDLGTSPVLTKDLVVVAVMHTGPSYLVAYEKATGKLAWKHDRNLGAPVEAAHSYSTPVLVKDGDRELLVVLGADHVTAHDAVTGKELWRVGGLNPGQNRNWRSIASPAVAEGIVVAPYARGNSLTAIRLGGDGDVTKTHILWSRDDLGADVPTPVAIDGKVYLSRDRGEVACLDLMSGKTLWTGNLPRHRTAYSSSPILAGGKLYLTREDGTCFVLAQGDEFKLLATNTLADGDQTVATPVFVDGQILLRTRQNLYCIGE